jgi:hypothetical protein
MKSLYAYFGLLDLHNIDSPGHSLYQIGLVDSIRESFGDEKFDFYSYYPEEVISSAELKGFPDTELGTLFKKYRDNLFDKPIHNIDKLLKNIENKEYSKLYLKARFRNLSTLAKKWKDAQDFERIIECALVSGYTKDSIIILDTDLSLSDKFIKQVENIATILIPSIDFNGISNSFLRDCVNIHTSHIRPSYLNTIFYGNINTLNYKEGNNKSEILYDILNYDIIDGILICKHADYSQYSNKFNFIDRSDRSLIWEALESSTIMLNITKEKYNEQRFIPARIYEAMIFGMIPVSYKFDFLCKAFSFETVEEFSEIYKYLMECTPEDIQRAYTYFIENYYGYLLFKGE